MKKTLVASALAAIIAAPAVNAVELYKDDTNSVSMGGIVDARVVSADGETDMANGWSRIYFTSEHQLTNGWSAFSKFEWGVNPFGNTTVNVNDNNEFSNSTSNFLNNRLGYVGLSHDKFGQVSFGKQWSVWYDVVGATNQPFAFDGNASGTYTYNKADGSFNGTGRADKAIQYRNAFGDFSFGVQLQLQQDDFQVDEILNVNPFPPQNFANGSAIAANPMTTVEYKNTYGFSATYAMSDKLNLMVGGNMGEFDAITSKGVSFSETDYIYGVGMSYGDWNDGLYVAANVNKNQNHDTDNAGRLLPESVGIETLVSYKFDNNLRPFLSYNRLKASDSYADTYGSNDEFDRQFVTAGVHYLWTKQVTLYAEGRVDFSDFTVSGDLAKLADAGEGNAVAFGVMYSF
ncbi:porin [Shewanella sp. NIFS-20-20]|uniref:porin n=1 Tax=Shewanella sp. NIFS-20-20 TaxID=2853806 RepID=UPI001C46E82F|nr:porin [Shewanella sp. NIFS-20-20]MBV7315954.1 porin [Shewanella sp. NIFS-20-20]